MIKFILFRIHKFLKMEQYINISEKTSTSGNIIFKLFYFCLYSEGCQQKVMLQKATDDHVSTIIPHP